MVALDVDVLGLRVRIELADGLDDQQRNRVLQAWSGAIAEHDGAPDLTQPFPTGTDFDRAMERLTVDVTLAALSALRGRALMFHAAGVADDSGRVVAFVGPSGRGKTTLSRELGRTWGYVSDETIAVDSEQRVHAYRKPLSVVRDGAPKRQLSPEDARLRELPSADLRLAALVLIERDAELREPVLEPVPLVEALPELVPQMSYLRDQGTPLQAIAALSDSLGGILRLRYPDAVTVASVLPQLFEGAASPSGWHPVPAPVTGGAYSAEGVDDAILTDGFIIVMVGASVQVLDGIAPVVWSACTDGLDLEGVIQAVVAEFGPPPEGQARERVQHAIDELVEAGVLTRR